MGTCERNGFGCIVISPGLSTPRPAPLPKQCHTVPAKTNGTQERSHSSNSPHRLVAIARGLVGHRRPCLEPPRRTAWGSCGNSSCITELCSDCHCESLAHQASSPLALTIGPQIHGVGAVANPASPIDAVKFMEGLVFTAFCFSISILIILNPQPYHLNCKVSGK